MRQYTIQTLLYRVEGGIIFFTLFCFSITPRHQLYTVFGLELLPRIILYFEVNQFNEKGAGCSKLEIHLLSGISYFFH